jgi:hypothetical protein
VFLLNDPRHIKHVLQDNYMNYNKGSLYDELRRMHGDGLVTPREKSGTASVDKPSLRFIAITMRNMRASSWTLPLICCARRSNLRA